MAGATLLHPAILPTPMRIPDTVALINQSCNFSSRRSITLNLSSRRMQATHTPTRRTGKCGRAAALSPFKGLRAKSPTALSQVRQLYRSNSQSIRPPSRPLTSSRHFRQARPAYCTVRPGRIQARPSRASNNHLPPSLPKRRHLARPCLQRYPL